ncbi:protein of unknown function [Modestobacter italicus]|uniref:Uncharacterized protein n=1 Tax=Modestobacter italicus (strain DSM 44449 / CECT 9708 / BC 501) TaxID=2732864 RepID=I4ERP8_MODI5|nr:hypothetical protein [Modestobacter marinus]CCH86061.1 protein of unknown function [Modestobacter marinus]
MSPARSRAARGSGRPAPFGGLLAGLLLAETIEFTVSAPGDHPVECSFHAALGQVGTMTVSG